MKRLHISPELSLPIDAVTQKLAFLGRTGSGKSYGASKMVEEMLDNKAQVIILDPVGIHWGLRLAADGKAPGITIPVFGGLHGDIPLESDAGALVADLAVDRGISMVLDVSQFEFDTQKSRFAEAFATRFFFRKKAAPSAVHLVLEECQEFVPQNPQKGEEKMLHSFQRLEKLGRNFGIGVSLISQRPQEIAKKALNQTECMFAFQMTGPQERDAIGKWVNEKGITEDIGSLLPGLAVGHPHVWSRQWLKVSKTIAISPKRTFDASATPEVGHAAKPRNLAPIDIAKLREDMKEAIAHAADNDPEALKERITELEEELDRRTDKTDPSVLDDKLARARSEGFDECARRDMDTLEVFKTNVDRAISAFRDSLWEAMDETIKSVSQVGAPPGFKQVPVDPLAWGDKFERLGRQVPSASHDFGLTEDNDPNVRPSLREASRLSDAYADPDFEKARQGKVAGSFAMTGFGPGDIKVLTAAAQFKGGIDRKNLTVLTGYKKSSRDTYIQRLVQRDYIQTDGSRVVATPAGLKALGPNFQPLPRGRALREHWLKRLTGGEKNILEVLLRVDGRPIHRDTLSRDTDYKKSSRNTYIQKLSARQLVVIESKGMVRASENLF